MPTLPYRKPQLGRDLWILDDALQNPQQVRQRCLDKNDWTYGFPYRDEGLAGNARDSCTASAELAPLEEWVKQQTGCKRLWQNPTAEGMTLNHNCVQLVGADEADARPHTDSRTNCRFASVIYLTPDLPADCGTAFYRQRLPGATGRKLCSRHHMPTCKRRWALASLHRVALSKICASIIGSIAW